MKNAAIVKGVFMFRLRKGRQDNKSRTNNIDEKNTHEIKTQNKDNDTNDADLDQPGKHLIDLRHIFKIYHLGGEEVRANDDVSVAIDKGEFVAIVGKSGSGKSTLMNIIGALDVPTKGEYYLGGEDVSKMEDKQLARIRNKMIGFIFQQYNLLPKLNLLENVELPLLYAGVGSEERKQRAMASLEKVGLAEKWKNMPNQLSGGQQQRVSIARALAGDPSLILADEPTGALDSKSARMLLESFRKLNEEMNATILMVTHDAFTASYCKRILFIKDGKLFNELIRGTESRKEFFDRIMEVIALLGGDLNAE